MDLLYPARGARQLFRYAHANTVPLQLRAGALRRLSTAESIDVAKARQFCEARISRQDRDASLIRRFVPRPAQDMYLALRALNLELVRLPETAHTPQLRTLRAVFWQDVIEQTFAGSPPREPICVLLRHALDSLRDRDPEASLATLRFWTSRLVKMRRKYIDNRPFVSIAALEEYAEHTYSGIMYATLAAAGVQSTVADHLASHIGKACGIVAVLRGVPVLAAPQQQADGRAGRKEPVLLLPLDVLATHGVREEEVYRLGPQAHGFCDAIFEVATRANDHLLTAREMLANLKQGKEVGHAFEHGDEEGHNHEALNVSQEWRAIKHSFGVFVEAVPAAEHLLMLEKTNFDPFKTQSSWKIAWRVWRSLSKETI